MITLPKNMLIQLEKEAEENDGIYDKLSCWYETNDGDKANVIKEAKEKIDILIPEIEQLTGLGALLSTEIRNLERDIAKSRQSGHAAVTKAHSPDGVAAGVGNHELLGESSQGSATAGSSR